MQNEYQKSVEQFSKVYNKMTENLTAWIEKQGGAIDPETGEISGLTDNEMIHANTRSEQLNTLLEYHTTAELYIQRLENTIKRLDIENQLLQKGRAGQTYSNSKILQEIEFYMSYEVDTETTLDDFTDVLRQTKFFIELGLKRKILDLTPEHENKLKWSNIFLDDTAMMKQFFNNKKQKLGLIAPSVENALSHASHDNSTND